MRNNVLRLPLRVTLMTKPLKFFATLATLALAALGWSHVPQRLPVAALVLPAMPPATPPAGMSLSALPTGSMEALAAFAYRGGALTEQREFSQTAVLVRHPKGDLLFDTGMGRHAAEHFAGTPWLMHTLSKLKLDKPVADQLVAQGYDLTKLAAIVPTHVHWDHISGVPDFPGTPVWLTAAEQSFITHGGAISELARSFGKLPVRSLEFADQPYLGFERSLDVWGDGAIVLVPTPGHTPGSIIAFITLPSGQRHALLGDLVWQTDGIERPAERPWISRWLVDDDAEGVRRAVSHVAALRQHLPQINWLPAHDGRAMGKLPVFPAAAQ